MRTRPALLALARARLRGRARGPGTSARRAPRGPSRLQPRRRGRPARARGGLPARGLRPARHAPLPAPGLRPRLGRDRRGRRDLAARAEPRSEALLRALGAPARPSPRTASTSRRRRAPRGRAAPSRNSSRSRRSLARPAARLFATNSLRPRMPTRRPPKRTVTRPFHARAKDTPLMLVMRSMRSGSRPSDTIRSRSAKRGACRARAGKPKAPSTRPSLRALAGVGSTRMSRSAVARGRPCAASACAPTITKRTRSAHNKPMSSLQSGGSFTVDPPGELPDRLDGRHALCDGPRAPVSQLAPRRGLGRRPTKASHHRDSLPQVHAGRQPEPYGRAPRARDRGAALGVVGPARRSPDPARAGAGSPG
jgi:hypothetical protein